MEELTEQKCEACRVGAPSVTAEEIKELQPQVSEWQIITEEGIPSWIAVSNSRTLKTPSLSPMRWAKKRKKKATILG